MLSIVNATDTIENRNPSCLAIPSSALLNCTIFLPQL